MMRPSVPCRPETEIGLPVERTDSPALESFRGTHCDGTHDTITQLLLNFQDQIRIRKLECLIDAR